MKYVTNPRNNTISAALQERNIPHFRILYRTAFFQVGLGYKQKQFSYDNINNSLATKICQDKIYTKQFLETCSLAIPSGHKVTTEEDLRKAYDTLQKPLVVKPVSEMWGMGITTNIQSWEEVLTAYNIASKYKGHYVIVEEHIQGDDHRILILGGEYIAGLKRTPPFVIGNGKNTIIELVKQENIKRKNSIAIVKEILIDETLNECLQSQSFEPDSIPDTGERVFVRMTGNICSGGISENITTQVHPSIIETCKDIGAYLNMKLLGVDVITTDISKPLSETGGKITEVNENPDISMHTAPYIGEAINTTQLFVDYLYPDPTDAWINITVDENIINKREELQQYLSVIPKRISQLESIDATKTITIDSPNKQLQQYLLDVRTISVIVS